VCLCCFFFSSRRRHTRFKCDWSSDVCSSDLITMLSFLASMRAQEFQQAIAEGHYRRGEAHDKPNPWDQFVIWMNRASGASFIAEIGRASCRERMHNRGVAGASHRRAAMIGVE